MTSTVAERTPPDDGLIRIDRPGRRAWQGARELRLTRQRYELLVLLHRHAGMTVTREEIMKEVWGSSWVNRTALSMTICHLRQALGDAATAPRYIANVHSVGYRLEAAMVPARAEVVELPAAGHRLPLRADGQLLYDADNALVAVAMSPAAAAWLMCRVDRTMSEEQAHG